jgi:hypothetical protein
MTAPESNPSPPLPGNDKDRNDTEATGESEPTFRSVLGQGSMQLSDFVNDHLIYMRPVTVVSIAALTIYSISQTPFFFRYRSVQDIPSHYFQRRKWIRGRLIPAPSKVEANPLPSRPSNPLRIVQTVPHHSPNQSTTEQPVLCYIRHLSPIESWMSKARWLRYRNLTTPLSWSTLLPPKQVGAGTDFSERDDEELIPIHIVGIQYPPLSAPPAAVSHPAHLALASLRTTSHAPSAGNDTIQQLSRQHLLVRCQLYGRVVPNQRSHDPYTQRTKRPIPNLIPPPDAVKEEEEEGENQIALAKVLVQIEEDIDMARRPVTWWSWGWSWLRRPRYEDLGEQLVRQGQAVLADDLLWTPPEMKLRLAAAIGDSTNNTSQRQRQEDVKYVTQLTRAEYEAAAAQVGIWSLEQYRNERMDVMEELQLQQQQQDTFVHRIWQWLTRRWRRE